MQNNILKFYFLKIILQSTNESLEKFLNQLFYINSKVLNPCEISINKNKQKKFVPNFDKNLGCYRVIGGDRVVVLTWVY
jgi:hypothetical protein